MDSTDVTDTPEDLYRIGTVAKLTNIAVERLRAWERRYGLLPAHRAGRTRYYSAAQVNQLQQIKRLLDQGHPISSLANLDAEQLAARLASARPQASGPAKVGLIGPNLQVLERQQQGESRMAVAARWENLDAYQRDTSEAFEQLGTMFVQLPVLDAEEALALQEQLPDTTVIVVYQFASATHLAELADNDLTALRWPVTWAELEREAASACGTPLRAARSAPRRYPDDELIAIAASHKDPTQCPSHLVELISQLNAFADYALSVAEEHAEADIYERIYSDTTQARAQLELALDLVAERDELLSRPN